MPVVTSALVSIYKSLNYLEGLLVDLTSQSHYKEGKLEIILIDSASPDNEYPIIKEFQRDYPNIVYIRTPERETLFGAWNTGLKLCKGKYITFANTDDRHQKEMLKTLTDVMEENPKIDLVYSDVYESKVDNETFDQNPKTKRYLYKSYFEPNTLTHYQFGCQPVWRKSVHDVIGDFNPRYKAAGDYEFNFRFSLSPKLKALHYPEALGIFLDRATSISSQDTASQDEYIALRSQYINIANIATLYGNAGWPNQTHSDWIKILSHLKERAEHVTIPWKPGGTFKDAGLIYFCGECSRVLNTAL